MSKLSILCSISHCFTVNCEKLNVVNAKIPEKCTRIYSWFRYLILRCSLRRVATTSKQMSWLFWNNFTNGNAKSGRYGVSLKMADQ